MAATLEYYVTRKEAASEAVQQLSEMLDVPSVRDLIVVVKTLELMEHYAQVDGYDALVEKMVNAARTVMTDELTQDDMMYVA
jgi:tRNA A37 threonylcarbamoyladenosine synthetase subunit TsaC/SUA5/YrdC